jgi:TadE-like protein
MASALEPTGNGSILGDGRVPPKERLVIGRGYGGRRRAADERGQALVEFVLLLPVFLLITFGIIEFGKGFNYWIDLTQLSNEGARYAAVNRWPGCPAGDDPLNGNPNPCPDPLKQYIAERANTKELELGGGNVTGALEDNIEICYPEGAGAVGNAVKVTVRTKYTLNVVDGLLGAIGLGDIGELDMHASSTMRLERTPSANRVGLEVSACT